VSAKLGPEALSVQHQPDIPNRIFVVVKRPVFEEFLKKGGAGVHGKQTREDIDA